MVKLNITSAAFWSMLGSVASVVCGALGLGHMGAHVQQALIEVGGAVATITTHHVVKNQIGTKAATNGGIS